MSLTGVGVVKAKPDEGYISVGVTTRGKNSATAVANNTLVMQELYSKLESTGVAKDKVQTLDFTVADNYKTTRVKDPETGKYVTEQVRDGYYVRNSIQITVASLDRFGDVLDVVTSSGANDVHGIAFGSSKAAEFTEQARKAAVADANRKAAVLTEGLGVKPGRVLSVAEGMVHRESGFRSLAVAAAAPGGADRSVPVSGGSLDFRVQVTVVWELVGK